MSSIAVLGLGAMGTHMANYPATLAHNTGSLVMQFRHLAMTIVAVSLMPPFAHAQAGDVPTKPAISYTVFDERPAAN